MRVTAGRIGLVVVAAAGVALPSAARAASTAPTPPSPSCAAPGWVGTWAAAPSDASRGKDVSNLTDASGNRKSVVRDETARMVLTPSLGGAALRVRLSNRFGTEPVTFARTTVARTAGGVGAGVAADTVTPVTFGGKRAVTVAPGRDALSDAATLRVTAGQRLAVSVFVAGDVGKATEHFIGRQTSYLTPDGTGDRTTEASGASFTEKTTARPFVAGVDVRARASTGAVVAFGDSITDGYQGFPGGIPEEPATIDDDARWPDVLARRLRAAGRPLAVLNTAISGNRVLRAGTVGGGPDTFGISALDRLDRDVLRQPGVGTVVWLEGINDIGQSPSASAASIIAGYRRGIARMHAAGLRVLQGTLTPTAGTDNGYDSRSAQAKRRQVNAWIRTRSPADGVVDFDAAVRDPRDPSRLRPAYDGGDHLHLSRAGYKRMGEAVPLAQLQARPCASARS